jgi:hypothetical protein
MMTALMFGVIGYAFAADLDPNSVEVTANVPTVFSLTVNEQELDFGTVTPGAAADTKTGTLRVKSNKPWEFGLIENEGALDSFLSYSCSLAEGAGDRGVTDVSTDYTLDLSDEELALDTLDPGTPYTATYVYSAVQTAP